MSKWLTAEEWADPSDPSRGEDAISVPGKSSDSRAAAGGNLKAAFARRLICPWYVIVDRAADLLGWYPRATTVRH